jgi:hypothetical protein
VASDAVAATTRKGVDLPSFSRHAARYALQLATLEMRAIS